MNEKDDQIAHFGIVPKCLILRQSRNSPWTRPDVQLFATTAVGRLRPVVHRTAPAHYRLGDRVADPALSGGRTRRSHRAVAEVRHMGTESRALRLKPF